MDRWDVVDELKSAAVSAKLESHQIWGNLMQEAASEIVRLRSHIRTLDETGLTEKSIGQAIDVAIECLAEGQEDMENYPQRWEGGAA